VDAGITRRRRDSLPLLFEAGAQDAETRLLWVPGVARAEGLTIPPALPGWHVSLDQVCPIGAAGNRKTGW
jgi:hypothetical protein